MKPKRPVSVFRHLYEQPYQGVNSVSLYNSAKGSLGFVQRLGLLRKLPVHYGCVNCICWSDNGQLLLSGSDDQRLVISHAHNFKKLTDYKTSHRANIFSAKFLPSSGDRNIISCSGDGIILFTDLNRPSDTHNNQFNCHTGTTYDVATVPGEPYTFLSCGEDFTVRCFDLRIKESCSKLDCQEDILISCQRAVTALTVNSAAPHQLAIGCSDSTVRLFDRRNLSTRSSGFTRANCVRPMMSLTAPGLEGKSFRITSLAYSPEGDDILVSYSSEHLYLFNCKNQVCTTMKPSIGEFEEDNEIDDDVGGSEKTKSSASHNLPPIRRLRLRGDWSDTGPDARPEREPGRGGDVAQARPTLHATLMQRMTDVLSRMLNDPATRAALSHGGEEDNPPTGPSEVDVGAGGEELGLSIMEGEERTPDNTLPSPARSQLSEGEGSEGSNDMVWSEDVNTSQAPTASSTTALAEETVSLPSFESTYSSYTNLVKSPAAASNQEQAETTDEVSPLNSVATSNSNSVATSTSAATTASVPVINVDEPSTSSSSSASVATPPPPAQQTAVASDDNSPTDQESLSCLTDQLFTMRHGFIEKHGTEPMVNLHYSEKGSTASRITMSVADEVNREVASTSTAASNSISQGADVGSSSASASAEPEPTEDVAGPSRVVSSPKKPPEPMSEEDDSTVNSDDESELPSVNLNKRLIHPIERHMESAIETARSNNSSCSTPVNPLCEKTKVPKQTPIKMKFTGHRNARTMIKEATFWGSDHVMSGSDCGHVFVWERASARLVMLLEADHHVVNCIQPHPHLPLLATSGIDYDVKLWAPVHHESAFNAEMAEELMKRNEVMLEETKDTITVPASFMIRMLACLNQIRRGGRSRTRRNETNSNE